MFSLISKLWPQKRRTPEASRDPAVQAEAARLLQTAFAGSEFVRAAAEADAYRADCALRRLQDLAGPALAPAPPDCKLILPASEPDARRTYYTDRLFLARTAGQLCRAANFKEEFCFVSGPRIGERAFVLSQTLIPDYERQSAVGVRVTPNSCAGVLEHLAGDGLLLVAHAHSHPGTGPGATAPSATDKAFLVRLDKLGHIAIGLIFDQAGQFVRFYAPDMNNVAVHISGRVTEVSKHVYSLGEPNVSSENVGA